MGNSSSGDSKALVDDAPEAETIPFHDHASMASDLQSIQELHVGEVLSPDGAYIGELDELGMLHGEGIQVFTDGRRYSGQFSKNVFNGAAVMVWPDGHSYIGQYVDNQKSGYGCFSWPNGRVYDGQWRNGQRHGQGNYTAVESYIGDYVKGQRHGDGVLIWPDGRRYSGQFTRGAFHGYAVMSWPNGKRYLGLFQDNQKHGDGLFLWPDGRSYEGQWAKGYRHGRGTFVDRKGKERCGIWRKDKLVEQTPPLKPPTSVPVKELAATREAMKGLMKLQPMQTPGPPEKPKQEQDQLNFVFDILTMDSINQEELFKEEFKTSLIDLGASPDLVEPLEIKLQQGQQGGVITGVSGPKPAVQELRNLTLDGRLEVLGDLARVEEVLSPEAHRALELARAAKAAQEERAIALQAARDDREAKRAELAAKQAKIEAVRIRRLQREEQREQRRMEKRAQSERAIRRQMLIQQNELLNQQLQRRAQSESAKKKRGKRRRKPPSQTRGSRELHGHAIVGRTDTGGRQSLVAMLGGGQALPAPTESPAPSDAGSIRSARQHPPRRPSSSGSLDRPPQHTMSRGELEELLKQPSQRREKPPHQQRRYAEKDKREGGASSRRPQRKEGAREPDEAAAPQHEHWLGGVDAGEFVRHAASNPLMAIEVVAEEVVKEGTEMMHQLGHMVRRSYSDDGGRGVGSSELRGPRDSGEATSPPPANSMVGSTVGGTAGSQLGNISQGGDSKDLLQTHISKLVHDPDHEIPEDLFQSRDESRERESVMVADQGPDIPTQSTSHRRIREKGPKGPK